MANSAAVEFSGQVENARALLMQKGNVIKIAVTIPMTQENWSRLGPFIGGYAGVKFTPLSEPDYQASINNQKGLFEGDGDVDDTEINR